MLHRICSDFTLNQYLLTLHRVCSDFALDQYSQILHGVCSDFALSEDLLILQYISSDFAPFEYLLILRCICSDFGLSKYLLILHRICSDMAPCTIFLNALRKLDSNYSVLKLLFTSPYVPLASISRSSADLSQDSITFYPSIYQSVWRDNTSKWFILGFRHKSITINDEMRKKRNTYHAAARGGCTTERNVTRDASTCIRIFYNINIYIFRHVLPRFD